MEIDECASSPCPVDSTCIDKVNGFVCKCKKGFSGTFCDTGKIVFYSKQVKYYIVTSKNETGHNDIPIKYYTFDICKAFSITELDNGYMLEFPSAGTFNYSASTFDQDLTSFTVSFWMQTDDNQNQGTPFSYASSDAMDNALTMTSYDGSVSGFRTGLIFHVHHSAIDCHLIKPYDTTKNPEIFQWHIKYNQRISMQDCR